MIRCVLGDSAGDDTEIGITLLLPDKAIVGDNGGVADTAVFANCPGLQPLKHAITALSASMSAEQLQCFGVMAAEGRFLRPPRQRSQ
jgi:hypothetical protein